MLVTPVRKRVRKGLDMIIANDVATRTPRLDRSRMPCTSSPSGGAQSAAGQQAVIAEQIISIGSTVYRADPDPYLSVNFSLYLRALCGIFTLPLRVCRLMLSSEFMLEPRHVAQSR